MKKLFIVLIAATLISSCATHQSNFSSSSFNKAVVYEDIATGIAESARYFGLGGLNNDALTLEAKRALYKNRPLQKGEQYANFTIDTRYAYYLFYRQQKLTISADVVRFSSSNTEEPLSDLFQEKLNRGFLQNDLFKAGDTIINNHEKEGVIISINTKGEVWVAYNDQTNYKTKQESIYKIYTQKKPYKSYRIEDTFSYQIPNSITTRKSQIYAFGLKTMLLMSKRGVTEKMKYPKER